MVSYLGAFLLALIHIKYSGSDCISNSPEVYYSFSSDDFQEDLTGNGYRMFDTAGLTQSPELLNGNFSVLYDPNPTIRPNISLAVKLSFRMGNPPFILFGTSTNQNGITSQFF